jgi:hypothetical protein
VKERLLQKPSTSVSRPAPAARAPSSAGGPSTFVPPGFDSSRISPRGSPLQQTQNASGNSAMPQALGAPQAGAPPPRLELRAPAVAFKSARRGDDPVTKDLVLSRYQEANAVLDPYGIHVDLEHVASTYKEVEPREGFEYTDTDRSSFNLSYVMRALHPRTTVEQESFPQKIKRLTDKYTQPGQITCFWFGSLTQDPDLEESFQGYALTAREFGTLGGREAVIANAHKKDVLAHELSHILGGKEQGDHVVGPDGALGTADPANILFSEDTGKTPTNLTPDQVKAFRGNAYLHPPGAAPAAEPPKRRKFLGLF